MLINVDIEIPSDLLAAADVDTRYTFRRTVENRMRPRFNKLAQEVAQVSIYDALAAYWRVEQRTEYDTVAFSLQNIHHAAQYLEADEGTAPHHITQSAHTIPLRKLIEWLGGDVRSARRVQAILAMPGHSIEIDHPGTKPDKPVQEAIASAEADIIAAADDALTRWMERFGAQEVA